GNRAWVSVQLGRATRQRGSNAVTPGPRADNPTGGSKKFYFVEGGGRRARPSPRTFQQRARPRFRLTVSSVARDRGERAIGLRREFRHRAAFLRDFSLDRFLSAQPAARGCVSSHWFSGPAAIAAGATAPATWRPGRRRRRQCASSSSSP